MLRILIIAAGVLLISFTGIAAAAEGSQPGSALYGVGRGLEQVRLAAAPEVCTGEAARPHPVASAFARRYQVPYEEILTWFCDGYGFGEVVHAYSISRRADVPVDEVFAQREAGLGWGQIWHSYGLIGRGPKTPGSAGRGEQEASGEHCVGAGADPHPVGQGLAERFGVSYDEIMGWFCQGYGFGEIRHAYSISSQVDVPVEEVFDQREAGFGWGQIRKHYGLIGPGSARPGGGPPPDKPGKGPAGGKPGNKP